jgi:hemolysin activation/secretion protein
MFIAQIFKAFVVGLILIPAFASAQAVPDPAIELRRQQEREQAIRIQQESKPDVRLIAPALADISKLPSDETPCFPISSVVLSPDSPSTFEWILDRLAGPSKDDSPIGRCLGAKAINTLLKRGQDAAIAKGFVTTRLLAQPQDLKTGKLVLSVVPGRIRTIRIDRADEVAHAPLVSAFPMKAGDLLNLRDIEQALENFKRLPTVEADFKIEPGQQPGESDIVVSWRQAKAWRLSTSLDDSGSQNTGKYQAGVTLAYENALGLSDMAYVTLNRNAAKGAAPANGGTEGLVVHYSLPYGYWAFAATASQSKYQQTVEGKYENYAYSGDSSNWELKASRLLYRDAIHKLGVSIKLQKRGSHNFIEDTEIEVQRRSVASIEVGLNHKAGWRWGSLDATLVYRQGLKGLGTLEAPEESFGEGTSLFKVVVADVALQVPFEAAGQKIKYLGSIKAQFNNTPLTPQDKFSIGSRSTVRGFDGEMNLIAERGVVLRNELSIAFGPQGTEAYVGLDYGRIAGTSVANQLGTALAGAALGLRGRLYGAQYEVFVGKALKKPEGFTTKSAFGFSLNYFF